MAVHGRIGHKNCTGGKPKTRPKRKTSAVTILLAVRLFQGESEGVLWVWGPLNGMTVWYGLARWAGACVMNCGDTLAPKRYHAMTPGPVGIAHHFPTRGIKGPKDTDVYVWVWVCRFVHGIHMTPGAFAPPVRAPITEAVHWWSRGDKREVVVTSAALCTPVLKIECIPKTEISVSHCIPSFGCVYHVCIPTFKSVYHMCVPPFSHSAVRCLRFF